MIKKRVFKGNNYSALWYDGKTMRIAIDPQKPITELEYPEFYDVKITGYCEGACEYCYMDSKKTDYHYGNVPKKIRDYFGPMSENERPFQVACLEEGEMVFCEHGAIPIKDIQIGDSVYDEKGKLVKVINTIKSRKDCYEITGSKGFKVTATQDHLFLNSDNDLVETKDINGMTLKTSSFEQQKYIESIDLLPFCNETSRASGKRGGSSGGRDLGDKICFMHTLSPIPKDLQITNNLMWLYGISVAEGSKRCISLHIKEKDYANKAVSIYRDIFGLDSNIIECPENNSQQVYFNESKTYRTVFFDAMEIGYGSKNVSIKFLYKLNDNFVLSALRGMFDGDGCYRKKYDKRYSRNYFVASYKTASKKMAYELTHLLKTRFGVFSALRSGISKERKIGGRVLRESIYYMVEIYGNEDINMLFPDVFKDDSDFKSIGKSKYSPNKKKNYIKINSVTPVGKKPVYDITLDTESSHLFTVSHGVITHNCGGGEPTSHPDFIEIMKTFKELNIEPNYTTNGMHLTDDIIKATQKYCGGVAVSCHPHLKDWWMVAANLLANAGVKLNFHIIISDKESIDYFKEIYDYWKDLVDYFVLLPYGSQGRAEHKDIDFKYLCSKLPEDQSQIAFGANFYPYLMEGDHNVKVSLYEPEIMSKFLDMSDMSIHKSSFSLNV